MVKINFFSRSLRACGKFNCSGSADSVDENAACAMGCKMCGGGGNFSQPMNSGRRAGCEDSNCIEFTDKTKFACGYKCGWKGPQFWSFADGGLQWGQHVGGDGSIGSRGRCRRSNNSRSSSGS